MGAAVAAVAASRAPLSSISATPAVPEKDTSAWATPAAQTRTAARSMAGAAFAQLTSTQQRTAASRTAVCTEMCS